MQASAVLQHCDFGQISLSFCASLPSLTMWIIVSTSLSPMHLAHNKWMIKVSYFRHGTRKRTKLTKGRQQESKIARNDLRLT